MHVRTYGVKKNHGRVGRPTVNVFTDGANAAAEAIHRRTRRRRMDATICHDGWVRCDEPGEHVQRPEEWRLARYSTLSTVEMILEDVQLRMAELRPAVAA